MFKNCPPTDFSIRENRDTFQIALDTLEHELSNEPLKASPIIGGEVIETEAVIDSIDPSEIGKILGQVQMAELPLVEKAYRSLEKGRKVWRKASPQERAKVIRDTGHRLNEQRYRLAALIVREAGKPWAEADADVVEAIDFCNYYAEQMIEIGIPRKTQEILGEENKISYSPKGIAAVISPWNFPLAIPCGMVTAALVTGNVVLFKPAEQTSLIAFELTKILLASGLPEDALAFLPGEGETIGDAIVQNPRTHLICFTGSRDVGLNIIEKASVVKESQRHIKRVIAELGGKNCVIVDEDADLDEAVQGILYSAFGYAGQKCSACSRVIGVGTAYEPFMKRFCEAAGDLIIGRAGDPSSFLGPVIDDTTQKRLLSAISKADSELSRAYGGAEYPGGSFVSPQIFRDVPTDHWLWKEEQFGPIVACRKANSIEEAVETLNNSEYALTGGIFSRSPKNIEYTKNNAEVGNLYINRGCTGAIVQRQPFGGFKLSGIGSKAGGKDYLLQFLNPQTSTENTMRRGFTPELT